MGTDVRYHVERRVEGRWQRAESEGLYMGEERNYALFAILAGVERRSGAGFEPIFMARGYPVDSPVVGQLAGQAESHKAHNRTWLTLKEMLDFPWHTRTVQCQGYVDADNFLAYRVEGRPERSYYDVPRGYEEVSPEEMEAIIEAGEARAAATLISWDVPYADFAGPFLTTTLPRLRELGEPEDVRLILSFDS